MGVSTKHGIFVVKHLSYWLKMKTLELSIYCAKEITIGTRDYYKWAQWSFNEVYKASVAVEKDSLVNWGPTFVKKSIILTLGCIIHQ